MLDKIVVLICLVGSSFAISTNVTVDGLGNVIGLRQTTAWTNRTIFSFRGIPYAQSPTGDLRFRPPVNVTSWNGTLNATEFATGCPQNLGPESPRSSVNEDCLTLNVYVPQVDDDNATLPVMIWIHGGTFTSGDAATYQPYYLLEENVILVVIQYRLGPLGLLCLQTDEVPGNVQFLDQIMAMQWVQDNIGYFGGNPKEVTLFGQSSGAASVNLHQFSPLSKGLFHRAIIQSGSAFSPWVMDYAPLDTAAKFGAVVGCNQTGVTEKAACFKGLDVQTILDGFNSYLALYEANGLGAIGGNRAVIQTAGTQKFLEEDPLTLIGRSEYSQMPMMGGVTKHDGSLAIVAYYMQYFLPFGRVNDTDYLSYNLTSWLVSSFGVKDGTGGISGTMTRTYFEESQIGNFSEMVPGLIDISSVLLFKSSVFKMMQANSRMDTSFLYTFGYFGATPLIPDLGLPFDLGVVHSEELVYLFPWTNLTAADDLTVAKRMVSLWASFATTGVPKVDGAKWKPMNSAFGPYLIIDREFHNGTNFLSEYTIAKDEGMTAVDRSSGISNVPQSSKNESNNLLQVSAGCAIKKKPLSTIISDQHEESEKKIIAKISK